MSLSLYCSIQQALIIFVAFARLAAVFPTQVLEASAFTEQLTQVLDGIDSHKSTYQVDVTQWPCDNR